MNTKIVAEVGINANGSLKIARQLIDVAVEAECDYVKFQKRHIPLVYSKEELMKPRESPWGNTTHQQKKGLEFDKYQFTQISQYCATNGIKWFASVWDPYSADLMADFDMSFVKIPSALITNVQLLEVVQLMPMKAIISTGMSSQGEIENCVNFLGDQIEYILSCTSTYPCKPEEINLNRIRMLRHLFSEYHIGFSNHSPGLTYIPAAVALGAEMVEFHITLDRTMYGSDQSSSIEPHGVKKVVQQIRDIEKAMGDGSISPYESEIPIREKLRIKEYKNLDNIIMNEIFKRKTKEVA
jgi:N-acetylneuraminate synthase